MCEFLWSDPEEINDWEANPRGAGVIFGSQLVEISKDTPKPTLKTL